MNKNIDLCKMIQLSLIKEWGYAIITIDDTISGVSNSLPESRRAILKYYKKTIASEIKLHEVILTWLWININVFVAGQVKSIFRPNAHSFKYLGNFDMYTVSEKH